MEKKIKLMAVGDIHGDKSLVKKLVAQADKEKADIVILTGDITWIEQSLEGLIGPFTKKGRDVLFIPGNHEHFTTTKFLSELYQGTKDIHGGYFRKGELGIFGAGHADSGPFSISEQELDFLLENSHEKIKDLRRKIMVTHMHPQGGGSEGSGFQGSESIRKAIDKFNPDFVFHGHVHEMGGVYKKIGNTKIFNVSRKPLFLEI